MADELSRREIQLPKVTRFSQYVSECQKDWDTYVQPLTHAYNMQTHTATGTSSFKVILLCQPPFAATFDKLTGLANNMPGHVAPRHKPHKLLKRIAVMKAAIWSRLCTAERRNKRIFDKNEHPEPTFKVGDFILVHHPRRAAFASYAADEMAYCRCSKSLQQTPRPYKVRSAQWHTVSIEKESI